MGTILASAVIGTARRILLDVNDTMRRWSDDVLLDVLNEGQMALIALNPSSSASTQTLTLVAGTQQVLPTDGMRFLRATRNIKADSAPGSAVSPVAFDLMDLSDTRWHSSNPNGKIWQFAPDPYDPRVFYVQPPAATGDKLEVTYVVVPAKISAITAVITLPDWYAPALTDYIVYRIHSENNGDATARARSEAHYEYFVNQAFGRPARGGQNGNGAAQ